MMRNEAVQVARGMAERGECPDGMNVMVVRLIGVQLIAGTIPRQVRSELQAAVRNGRLGRLPKQGLKPEAFFHPNSLWRAREERDREERNAIQAISRVCVAHSPFDDAF